MVRRVQGKASLKRWLHLPARFFDVLTAEPLSESDRGVIVDLLKPWQRAIFFAQSPADQRHGLETCRALPPGLAATGLLHDAGKRHSRLGVLGRVAATLTALVGLPLRGRYAQYIGHPALAAAELSDFGAEGVDIRYVRFHHGKRPADYPLDEWSALQAADSARIISRR